MPRANSPFLTSISGSLRGGPTFRATSQTPDIVMQTRPVPTDRRTAKQAAVRDAYSRLAYLWSNLSQLDKEPYEIMAEARNLTPWNCWLSFHMPIMRRTPRFYSAFSEGSGSTLHDFAINGDTGTLNGPSWQEKNQFPNLYFDGVDDRITFNRPGYYDSSSNFSLYLIIRPGANAAYHGNIISTRPWVDKLNGFLVNLQKSNRMYYSWSNGTTDGSFYPLQTVNNTQINSIGFTKNGESLTSRINGITQSATTPQPVITPSTYPLSLGAGFKTSYYYKGNILIATIFQSLLSESDYAALDAHYLPFFT